MSKKRSRMLALALVSLLLLGSLIRCGPTEAPTPEPTEPPATTESPEPTEPPATKETPEPTEPTPQLYIDCTPPNARAQDGSDTDRHTIRNQIIVTGPASAVQEVVQAVQEDLPELELEPLRTCEVYVPRRETLNPEMQHVPDHLLDVPLRLDLYGVVPEERDVALEILNTRGAELDVVADPNYITSLYGQSMCGSPYSVVGSPYSVVGSPYSVVGSPGGSALSPAAAENLFWGQWAWGQTGLGPALPSPASDTFAGTGIRVGVMDTAPYDQDGAAPIDWMSPSWTLTVSLTAVPIMQPGADLPLDISNHGLFVAGLIHGAASDSDIRLVQVLDEYGCGSLHHLATQVFTFTEQVDLDRQSLGGAVLNLSLGVPITNGVAIPTLELPVSAAVDAGIVVVAAAGNDSYVTHPGPPQAAQLPAAYKSVIGVGASNIIPDRACFSNQGNVLAPGGEGGHNANLIAAKPALAGMDCLPMVDQCAGPCDYALISLGLIPDMGYYYWSGTSFSSPLVSGLAALVLQAGGSVGAWMAPEAVLDAIECSTAGTGVINAPATLLNCITIP
jgi:hypothetical protein